MLQNLQTYAQSDLPTNIVDFTGLDSSTMLTLRGEIPRPIVDFPETLSRAMSVGTMLVGRLGVSYTLRRRGVTRCCIGRFARDVYEQPASAVRCAMVLHGAVRARHPKYEMQHLTSTGSIAKEQSTNLGGGGAHHTCGSSTAGRGEAGRRSLA